MPENNNPYSIIQLENDLYAIEEGYVRSFLLVGRKAALLIDTGNGSGDLKAEVEKLTKLPIIVINTHSDGDHTGNNKQFDRIYLHPAEFERYRKLRGTGDTLVPAWESDFIDIGGGRLEVLLIPGHTPGSIALLDSRNRILFGGDTVSDAQIYMYGDGRNMEAYVYSLEKLIFRNDFDAVYACHGNISVSSGHAAKLAEGARRILEGGITPSPYRDECDLYDIGAAKILYR